MARTPRTDGLAPQGNARPKLRRGLGNRTVANAEDDAAKVARKLRRERVVELRTLHKLTFAAIGRELQISRRSAERDFDNWLAHNPSPAAEKVRAEEEPGILDMQQENRAARRMVLRHMAKENLSQADLLECTNALAALERAATRISESRRKLHGADRPVPVKNEHTGANGGPIQHVTIGEIEAALQAATSNSNDAAGDAERTTH